MLESTVIGYLGADAEVKISERGEFVTMRISHDDSWTDEAGSRHGGTIWVDAVMSCHNGRPGVLPYLLKGTMVFVRGSLSLRCYSSQKDKMMKAGATINVRDVQLLGGKVDSVPRQLCDEATGAVVPVLKYYYAEWKNANLLDKYGNLYKCDENGWVTPVKTDGDAPGSDISNAETNGEDSKK